MELDDRMESASEAPTCWVGRAKLVPVGRDVALAVIAARGADIPLEHEDQVVPEIEAPQARR